MAAAMLAARAAILGGGGGCAVLGTVVCDALMRHCLSDEFEVQHECKLQCPHTFIEMVITYRWVLRFYAFFQPSSSVC